MIRVPSALIPAVRQLSKLHREGHTIALLQELEEVISKFDSITLCRLQHLQRSFCEEFTLLTFSTTLRVDTELTSPKRVSTFHR